MSSITSIVTIGSDDYEKCALFSPTGGGASAVGGTTGTSSPPIVFAMVDEMTEENSTPFQQLIFPASSETDSSYFLDREFRL